MAKTLFEHAEYELKKLDLVSEGDESKIKIVGDTLSLVKRFEKQAHSEYTGKWVLDFFETLCNFLPLSPITNDPAEWTEYEDRHKNVESGEEIVTKRWQNKRAPSIISMDGGKTFVDVRTNKDGTSVDHIKQDKQWAKEKAERLERKKMEEAKKQTPVGLAKPPVDTSVPASEQAPVKSKSQRRREAALLKKSK